MVEHRFLQTVAPPDVGVHGAALDGAGPDERHLHHEVVERARFEPGQGGHLGAGFHLEHAHRVTAAQHVVDRRVRQVELGQVHLEVLVFGGQVDRVVQGGEHAESEQIEFDQPDRGAVVLVPLQDGPAGHARPFDGHHVGDRPVADHHASGVDAQVPGQPHHLLRQREDVGRQGVLGNFPFVVLQSRPAVDALGPGVLLSGGVTQRAGDVADGRAAAVGDHVGHLRGVVAAVAGVDVLDRFFSPAGFDVHVDVGRAVAFRGQESFEQQVGSHRVDVGDAQGVADRGVGSRAAALTEDAFSPAELDDVVDHEEIPWKTELGDHRQFAVDLCVRLWGLLPCAVAAGGAGVGVLGEHAVLRVSLGYGERGQLRRDEAEVEGAFPA